MNSATERSTNPAAETSLAPPTDHPLGDPPPYTPNPSFIAGESTLEQGPARPFQSPTGQNNNASQSRSGLLQVLNNTFNGLITQLDNSQRPRPPQHTWTAYPGQQTSNRHPAVTPVQTGTSLSSTSVRSPSPMRASHPSSDFIRDFYAAGTGDTVGVPVGFVPPPGPPRLTQTEPESHQIVRKPTAFPVVGHPLLRDGKLLLYPKNYICDKCHNIGYKDAEPSRPCKRCWNNYAKPFSGPLAYSFSSFSDEGSNFQRPLPALGPGGFGGPGYSQDRSESFLARQPTGSSVSYQPHVMSHSHSVPPRGSVVYNAGDPRIGGVLCWQCRGKGNVSFLFDRINCDICGGVGRVFDM